MPALSLNDLDPATVARLTVMVLIASLIMALLQDAVRRAIWSLFNVVATFFSFLAGALFLFVTFLTRIIMEGIEGLSQEGRFQTGEARPWNGWYIIGPLVYFVLTVVFVLSDLTVAVLIFEAMGLTLGIGSRVTIPIPLDAALGTLFVALALFWGIMLFDLLRLTPFAYIWSGLADAQRRRFLAWVVVCLGVTVAAGMMMGVWSQAQLRGGMPDPWNTVIPWLIRGSLVALLISATALSGKPLGSALTAMWIAALIVLRAVSYLVLILVRLVLVIVRQVFHIPVALVALLAFLAQSVWNWVAGFQWAERLRIGRLTITPLLELGAEGEAHLSPPSAIGRHGASGADLAAST